MFKNNVNSFSYLLRMFYYNEYSNYLVNVHINEKTKFYTYKYFLTFKSITIILKYINFRYNIVPNMLDSLVSVRNNLFFFSYLNVNLHFMYNNSNYYCYNFYINNKLIYKYNMFYYLFIGYFYNEFKNSLLMELSNKDNNLYKNIKINLNKLVNLPSNEVFNEIKNITSLINIIYSTNTSNYYFNKLFFSHTLFNV